MGRRRPIASQKAAAALLESANKWQWSDRFLRIAGRTCATCGTDDASSFLVSGAKFGNKWLRRSLLVCEDLDFTFGLDDEP